MSEYELREMPVLFDTELEFIFRVMPDEVLQKLRGVIEYAIESKYYQKEGCKLSQGGLSFLVQMIDDESKMRLKEVYVRQ